MNATGCIVASRHKEFTYFRQNCDFTRTIQNNDIHIIHVISSAASEIYNI